VVDLNCRECGLCCIYYSLGGVLLSNSDIKRIYDLREDVLKNYTTDTINYAVGYGYSLGYSQCTFLDGFGTKCLSCMIYDKRPDVCRLYECGSSSCNELRKYINILDIDDLCINCGACCVVSGKTDVFIKLSLEETQSIIDNGWSDLIVEIQKGYFFLRGIHYTSDNTTRCSALRIYKGQYFCNIYECKPKICNRFEQNSSMCKVARYLKGRRLVNMEQEDKIYDCQKCGACCSTVGDVDVFTRLLSDDLRRIQAILGSNFDNYVVKVKDSYYMRGIRDGKLFRCLALKGDLNGDNKQVYCEIYEHRPTLCKNFVIGTTLCLIARNYAGVDKKAEHGFLGKT
jgi:Fe-S-cluster containining protein